MDQRKKLESAAIEYNQLKGLLLVPLGLLLILAALGNWRWGPMAEDWVFVAALFLAAAAHLGISRFYDEHYGQVTLSAARRRRAIAAAVITAPVVFGVSVLLRSRVEWSLDLPVNPVAATIGALMLATYAAGVGLRRHQVIICGGLLLAGVLPVWTGSDPGNVGLVLSGAAAIATGVLDHLALARAFGAPAGLRLADGDVEP